ncbi:MAG: urease accessory protein UreD [Hyphomicrobiaceae bacterium]
MSAVTYPCDTRSFQAVALDSVRVSGGVHISVDVAHDRSRVVLVEERDGYKARFPRRAKLPEAVIINTGGGLASGDKIVQSFEVLSGAHLTVTSQACERVYRSTGGSPSRVKVMAEVKDGGTFHWLPQETIVFNEACFDRTIEIDLTGSARALIAETLILGRQAMGEKLNSVELRDTWRMRRDGRLVFAENTRVDSDALSRSGTHAITGGATVLATVLYVAPDAEAKHLALRRVHEAQGAVQCAVSAWNGIAIVRARARDSASMRDLMTNLLTGLAEASLPRVWAN